MKNVSHNLFHPMHVAYGHNRDINEAVLPHEASITALINLATCELKSH